MPCNRDAFDKAG